MATATDGETVTDIEQVQGVLTEFSRVEAGLAALRAKHGNTVYEVSTTAGMDAAKAARAEIREPRFAVEKVRKAAKAPLLAIGRRIDAEAARITEAILAIEMPIDDQIKLEEARKVAEREAKRAAEVERLRLEAAAKLKAEEERLAAERSEIAAEQARLSAERARIDAEAAEARREAELEMAAQRKAIAEERALAEAEARRVADEQAAEAKRLAAERAAFEARQAKGPVAGVAGINNPDNSDDPMAVWHELNAEFETLDLTDEDSVKTFFRCCLGHGQDQAEELIEARAESKWGP
jgi:hypothetical protein